MMVTTTTHMTPQSGISLAYHDNNDGAMNGKLVDTSPAFSSAVTAYATRVLSYQSPPEACFDSSVASHIVSTLQTTLSVSPMTDYTYCDIHNTLQDLDEYQSLLELLEEHCNMNKTVAHNTLQSIFKAIRTGDFDSHGESTLQHVPGSSPGEFGGMINLGGSHVGSRLGRYRSKSLGAEHDYGYEDIDCITRLGNMLQESNKNNYSTSLFSTLITNEQGDGVIEEETSFLLEEDELPRTPHVKQSTPLTSEEEISVAEELNTLDLGATKSQAQSLTPLKPDRLIPVDLLGAIDDTMSPPAPKTSTAKCRGKKKTNVKSKDLAAALFCSRPRSNSLQSEKSPRLQPIPAPTNSYGSMSRSSPFQKQLDSTVQMLMAMNHDICEDAAYEAALVSNGDVNVAQHVIDGALAAPPVCRHMLNGGCYRSDCQYDHNVDGHTCSFWLRGRCGKGNTCKFMHGFSKKLLDGVKVKFLPGQHQSDGIYASRSEDDSDTKPIAIKTANLVQHNMKTSFSLPDHNESRGSFLETNRTLFNCLPATPSNSLPTRTFVMDKREHTSFSLRVPDDTQSTPKAFSFARIASSGYDKKSSYFDATTSPPDIEHSNKNCKTVRIPQSIWNACYNRPSTAFHIQDPLERYTEVSSSMKRDDIVDLHFQSVKSFSIVLSKILPEKLRNHSEVWIVTGTGHHIMRNTHKKSGGVLENSLIDWLTSNNYKFLRGKDKNGIRGAVLVKR